jgi:signal transduction histidine kinase
VNHFSKGTDWARVRGQCADEVDLQLQRHGMGIALAISQTSVEAHGGPLWAMPNKASGTTFRFQLPFKGATSAK